MHERDIQLSRQDKESTAITSELRYFSAECGVRGNKIFQNVIFGTV